MVIIIMMTTLIIIIIIIIIIINFQYVLVFICLLQSETNGIDFKNIFFPIFIWKVVLC